MAKEKKGRKFGRNSRAPSGGANQKMRTARNKRLNIERFGGTTPQGGKPHPGAKPKPAPNEYTSKFGRPPRYPDYVMPRRAFKPNPYKEAA